MFYVQEDVLAHIGTPHSGSTPHSGRYKWGSGQDPFQTNTNFYAEVQRLKKQGLGETEIATGMGMSVTEFRQRRSIARSEVRAAQASRAEMLREKGHSISAIAKDLGMSVSTTRKLLDPASRKRTEESEVIAEALKKEVDKKRYVDVGRGTSLLLDTSDPKLSTAIRRLEDEGYKVMYQKVPQLGTNNFTSLKVLVPPGVTHKELYENRDKIRTVDTRLERTKDGVKAVRFEKPVSISSKRVKVRYAEEGGNEMDGVIQLRRGVDDISLGKSSYAQVRVLVDGTHYLKGMAVYSDDLPKGTDLVFNTNKSKGTPMMGPKDHTVLKPIKSDPENPFGASFKMRATPKGKQSALNIVNEESSWSDWSSTLSSQMLSKQRYSLVKQQLTKTSKAKEQEYAEIMKVTNPTLRKKLLAKFADSADSDAVSLKAAALPRQGTHVILPVKQLKDNEVYAPNYRNGERVVLIRYPHAGTFEIPELVVNNRSRAAQKTIGKQARDAIGINHRVAARLSGADFDGDTVLCIPNNDGKIKTSKVLAGLNGFDPSAAYPKYPGMKVITPKGKQTEMGRVSNLITDMTLKGAPLSDIAKAVRHSMVVIDAEKHELNYKQSEIDNDIPGLKKKYQGSARAGASTLISRASSKQTVVDRRPARVAEGGPINKRTGKLNWVTKEDAQYTVTVQTKNGPVEKTRTRLLTSTKMYEVDDARKLLSKNPTPTEIAYADYANHMKQLARRARVEMVRTKDFAYSPAARKKYQAEYISLREKLRRAKSNAPLERQAQILANAEVRLKRQAKPNMENDELRKIKGRALSKARGRVGAKKEQVVFSPREWEAIQKGAISSTMLSQLLDNADIQAVKQLATPRAQPVVTSSAAARMKTLARNGATTAEIAEALGVSSSTVGRVLREES